MTPSVYQQVRTAVLSIGYFLSFGAMFSKTWRVYKLFTAGISLKKMVKFRLSSRNRIDRFWLECMLIYDAKARKTLGLILVRGCEKSLKVLTQ